MTSPNISSEIFETALGWIAIAATERGIIRTSLPEPTPDAALEAISHIKNRSLSVPNQTLNQTKQLLTRYCNGESVSLDDIPIDDSAWTPYTQRARAACRTIPRGEFRTYAWLAEQASGNPKSARAAGRAMATNPVPIIIPCHRVIGSNGNLHGFGGTIGIPLKARLLKMEGSTTSPPLFASAKGGRGKRSETQGVHTLAASRHTLASSRHSGGSRNLEV